MWPNILRHKSLKGSDNLQYMMKLEICKVPVLNIATALQCASVILTPEVM